MKNLIPELHLKALEAAKHYQASEVSLLQILEQIDREKVYLVMGYNSLFIYCVEALKLSESQSYSFMTVCRKSKEVPELKKEIESGGLTLSKARRIVPVLTKENHSEWIEKAKTLPKAELEKEVAKVSPFSVKIKEQVRAISEDRVSLKLDFSEVTLKKLKRAQMLLMNKRRKNLNLEESLNELLDGFLQKNDPLMVRMKSEQKKDASLVERNRKRPLESFSISSDAREKVPGPGQGNVSSVEQIKSTAGLPPAKPTRMKVLQRNLPKPLRREIFQRDAARCTYKGVSGKICGSQNFLQIHHLRPWAQGGNHQPENLQTLCAAHHGLRHEAEVTGDLSMKQIIVS
jgi:hypothetical protein